VVLFNYAIREVTAKIVYYGPGLCGKTTNLQFIHEKLDPSARGKLLSLATDGDRTLFFDFLPIEMGSIGGYKVRFQLYTVPGQVHYNATRKLVLKGVDAVAFVADSQLSMLERNRESFQNLIENLVENGYDPAKIPIVIQLNKRDLPEIASVEDLVSVMGVEGYPWCEAIASRGDGVFEALKMIVKLTLSRLRIQFDSGATVGGAEQREEPPPPPPAAVFAPEPPVPEATAPQPLETEIEVPAASVEGFDEFDLEYFSDEKVAPARVETPEDAFEEEVPGTAGLVDPEETSLFEAVDTPVEPPTDEPPLWAGEMMAELQRLRAENNDLREALRGIKTLLDRQIDVLRDGRDALDRQVGGSSGESES